MKTRCMRNSWRWTKYFVADDQLLIFFAGHGSFRAAFGSGYLIVKDSVEADFDRAFDALHRLRRPEEPDRRHPCPHILVALATSLCGTFRHSLPLRRGALLTPTEDRGGPCAARWAGRAQDAAVRLLGRGEPGERGEGGWGHSRSPDTLSSAGRRREWCMAAILLLSEVIRTIRRLRGRLWPAAEPLRPAVAPFSPGSSPAIVRWPNSFSVRRVGATPPRRGVALVTRAPQPGPSAGGIRLVASVAAARRKSAMPHSAPAPDVHPTVIPCRPTSTRHVPLPTASSTALPRPLVRRREPELRRGSIRTRSDPPDDLPSGPISVRHSCISSRSLPRSDRANLRAPTAPSTSGRSAVSYPARAAQNGRKSAHRRGRIIH